MLIPVSVAIVNSGSGYVPNDTLPLPGGAVLVVTGTTSPTGGGITSVSILTVTPYTMAIPNPVYPLGGSGVNASFNLTWQNAPVSTPACAQRAWLASVQASVANTNRDGSGGGMSPVIAPGAGDGLLDCLRFKALATTTAGMLRIFLFDGTSYYFFDEITTSAATPSGTVVSDSHTWYPPGGSSMAIPAGWGIAFTTHNAEQWQLTAVGSLY